MYSYQNNATEQKASNPGVSGFIRKGPAFHSSHEEATLLSEWNELLHPHWTLLL